jgi:Leucine-rich repeat (LRR) protein
MSEVNATAPVKKLKITDKNAEKLNKKLPKGLGMLWCIGRGLTELPVLPSSLKLLIADNNEFEQLPELPSELECLSVTGNKLNGLPELPNGLTHLYCSGNNITNIELTGRLAYLQCDATVENIEELREYVDELVTIA